MVFDKERTHLALYSEDSSIYVFKIAKSKSKTSKVVYRVEVKESIKRVAFSNDSETLWVACMNGKFEECKFS